MQIRFVQINNFRGIREMEWRVGGSMACLVGPGDSTKTTILDAIELALSPRYHVPFSDTDFHEGNIKEPIVITVTVGLVPDRLLSDDKFGLFLRGWNNEKRLIDEPTDDSEAVLSVQLKVDDSLEPTWQIINDRDPEGRKISWRDRQAFGVNRLGSDVDRHLTWMRGSALIQLTESQSDISSALADTYRQARGIFREKSISMLDQAAKIVEEEAKTLGVKASKYLHPGLDTKAMFLGAGAISLFDGEVPIRMIGLGTRRLIALSLQKLGVPKGAIILIDELEHGLEPHRIRHLLRMLQQLTFNENDGVSGSNDNYLGQIILTTHSPTVTVELPANKLRVVQSSHGITNIKDVDSSLQPIIRSAEEALLGRKVIVCEGKTELGICKALEESWVKQHDGVSLSYIGAVLVVGGGSKSPNIAMKLSILGYAALWFGDSDCDISPDVKTLQENMVTVVQWTEQCNIEQRLAYDLPWEDFKKMIQLAMDIKSEESIRSSISSCLGRESKEMGNGPDSWLSTKINEERIRRAVAKTAKKNRWFKTNLDFCEKLGDIVREALPKIPETDLAIKLKQIEEWAYE